MPVPGTGFFSITCLGTFQSHADAQHSLHPVVLGSLLQSLPWRKDSECLKCRDLSCPSLAHAAECFTQRISGLQPCPSRAQSHSRPVYYCHTSAKELFNLLAILGNQEVTNRPAENAKGLFPAAHHFPVPEQSTLSWLLRVETARAKELLGCFGRALLFLGFPSKQSKNWHPLHCPPATPTLGNACHCSRFAGRLAGNLFLGTGKRNWHH